MRRQWFIAVSLLFVLSFVSLNIVSSQSQSGMITGTVKDTNGAVVAGAQVTVRSEATGATRDAVTDNQGQFKIDELASGGYKVTVNATVSNPRNGISKSKAARPLPSKSNSK